MLLQGIYFLRLYRAWSIDWWRGAETPQLCPWWKSVRYWSTKRVRITVTHNQHASNKIIQFSGRNAHGGCHGKTDFCSSDMKQNCVKYMHLFKSSCIYAFLLHMWRLLNNIKSAVYMICAVLLWVTWEDYIDSLDTQIFAVLNIHIRITSDCFFK